VIGLLLAIFALYNVLKGAHPHHGSQQPWAFRDLLRGAHPTKEVLDNLGMTEVQCRSTFPGLFTEIDESVSRGPFQLERANDDYMGLVQGRIKDGKVGSL
jgi:DNA-directed RNA polymerase subunit N (RpoN/RPB10)